MADFTSVADSTRSQSKKRIRQDTNENNKETISSFLKFGPIKKPSESRESQFNRDFSPSKKQRNSDNININQQVLQPSFSVPLIVLPLNDTKKYCPEVYKFKTGKKDSNEYQIAIVFPECKKGGKKTFYSRKGRRNKRSRKTRKRK